MFRQPFFKIVCLSLGLIFWGKDAHCFETYYIDNNPLFLYKTINWWYDSLQEESKMLCGRPIKCTNVGNAQVVYDEGNGVVELKIKGGFATMLLPFKKCKQCYGPSYFHCTWLDQKYFNETKASAVLNGPSEIDGFAFGNIKKEKAKLVQDIARDLRFEMEGVIGGLVSGRVALHASGDLLKNCSQTSQAQKDAYPITLKIINAGNNEILAIFNMFWER